MSAPQTPTENSAEEDHVVDPNDMARFRESVIEYLRLPDEIERLNEPVKLLKARHKEIEKEILEFMRVQNIDSCVIPDNVDGGGLLVPKVSVTKGTVKKDNWTEGWQNFCKKRGINGANFDDLEKEVKETCPKVTKTTLKRVKR